jgi:hypothetical protein
MRFFFEKKKGRKTIELFSSVSVVIENFDNKIHSESTRKKILKTYDGVMKKNIHGR